MNWEQVARLAVAILPLLTALLGAISRGDAVRRRMATDTETLQRLPADSAAHQALLDVLARDAGVLKARQTYTRDYSSLALAIGGSLLFGYLTIWLWSNESWWGWLGAAVTGFVWLIFFFGIFDSVQVRDQAEHKRVRDQKKAVKAAAKSRKRPN